MSTTTSPDTVSYTDDRGVIRLSDAWAIVAAAKDTSPSPCGGCGETFPSLDALLGHPCSGSTGVQVPTDVALVPADTPDRTRPQGNGTGRGRQVRTNRYAGQCAECGGHVAAEAGRLFRGSDGWGVQHHPGECVEQTAAPEPQPERAERPCRPNRYAGACRHCGQHVAAEAGFLCRGESGWEVEHNGPCPEATTTPAVAVEVPAGYYAIDSTGHNDLAFYRIDRPTEGKWAGRVFVKLVVGGHADRNVARNQVDGILARIAADGPKAAAERYGRELGHCGRCGRELTDEESRAVGIGPVCRAMAW